MPVGDKMFALLGVACQRSAGHGQFQSKLELDRGIDHGIESEDLLLSVGVLGVASNSDSGIHVGGELRATKEEGVIFGTVVEGDFGNDASLEDEIEACLLKFFLEVEDLVEDTGLARRLCGEVVGVGLLKAKGQDLHPWSGDIWRESVGRAVCPDTDFFAHDNFTGISEAIKDALSHVIDDTSELDVLAVFAEIGAAFVPGIGWKKGAVDSQDFKGDETQKLSDFHEGMEDTVV